MLLDTSGLLCCHNRKDARYALAKPLFRTRIKKITHSYVLSEFLTLVGSRQLPREPAILFTCDLIDHPQVEVIWVTEPLHREAMELLRNRPDKDYSLCDAVSFVLMRGRAISQALTTDRHFEQEGFERLLPAS